MKFEARVWKFPANINTDLILPSGSIYLSQAEQVRLIFKANRPGWVDEVKPGDIIIGGKTLNAKVLPAQLLDPLQAGGIPIARIERYHRASDVRNRRLAVMPA